MIFDTIDDRHSISPYTSVDCTGEETALLQCNSSLSISGFCQYILVDCNSHTDIDPNIDPPNNEESTEETDTGNDDDDKDSTEETGNEGNDITTEDGTASAGRATKFIVGNKSMDYKDRLIHLHLLPLMMEFEISDIIFLVKSMKNPSAFFDIFSFIKPCNLSTRSSSSFKLRHSVSKNNSISNSYFNRIPRLWNSLPPLDITLSLSAIKSTIRDLFWNHFISNFNPDNVCSYHYLCPCNSCSKLPVNMIFTK